MRTFTAAPLFRAILIGLTASALHAVPAMAQTPPPPPGPDAMDSRHHDKPGQMRAPELALRADASREVKQDTINIVLQVQSEGATQEAAGKQLTAALDALVKRARGNDAIDLRTGNYRVYPVINDKGKTTGWQGTGELRLESRDFPAASALASKLSDASAIGSLRFSLSREAREAQEKSLLNDAAKAFKARAEAAATAFGFTGYKMGRLTLGGTGGTMARDMAPAPYMMSAMARKEGGGNGPEVPLEPDTELVTVDVEGTIYLQ